MDSESIKNQLDRIEKRVLISTKKALTFEEAVIYTGLSKSLMYKLTSTNGIPCYKPRQKLLYFDREELEKWLLTNRNVTNNEIEDEVLKYETSKSMKELATKH